MAAMRKLLTVPNSVGLVPALGKRNPCQRRSIFDKQSGRDNEYLLKARGTREEM